MLDKSELTEEEEMELRKRLSKAKENIISSIIIHRYDRSKLEAIR